MTSGFQLRNGQRGTDNLSTGGRSTIPAWAQRAYGVGANQSGPAVSTQYPLGRYMEDNAFLGDLTHPTTGQKFVMGVDYDLDEHNGRWCVTPEFPAGTYAYFVTIAADGSPQFPYVIGRWYYGSPTGGAVSAVTETVTEYVRSGPTTPIVIAATASGTGVALNWSSVEGATYRIESSADGATWTTVAAAVTSTGQTTGYAATAAANFFRVTVAAIAAGRADRLTLGNLDARRDWGWAPDVVDAMVRAVRSQTSRNQAMRRSVSGCHWIYTPRRTLGRY